MCRLSIPARTRAWYWIEVSYVIICPTARSSIALPEKQLERPLKHYACFILAILLQIIRPLLRFHQIMKGLRLEVSDNF